MTLLHPVFPAGAKEQNRYKVCFAILGNLLHVCDLYSINSLNLLRENSSHVKGRIIGGLILVTSVISLQQKLSVTCEDWTCSNEFVQSFKYKLEETDFAFLILQALCELEVRLPEFFLLFFFPLTGPDVC